MRHLHRLPRPGLSLLAIALLATPALAQCTHGQAAMAGEAMHAESKAAPATSPATMAQVFTEDSLFTCPMHPAVVSVDAEQGCPLCGMHLERMSAEAVAALRAEALVGCPMDPIVVKAAPDASCPVCGMALMTIAPPAKGTTDAAKDQSQAGGAACTHGAGCCKG